MKKEFIKKIVLSVLSLAILLSFTGCGSSPEFSEKSSSSPSSSITIEENDPKTIIENDANEKFSDIDSFESIVVKENDGKIDNISNCGYIVAINISLEDDNTGMIIYGANVVNENVSYTYGGAIAEIDGAKYYQLEEDGSWYDENGNELNLSI